MKLLNEFRRRLKYIPGDIFEQLIVNRHMKCYQSTRDYFGECDEYCICGKRDLECGSHFVCYLPLFAKRIAARIEQYKLDKWIDAQEHGEAPMPSAAKARAAIQNQEQGEISE